MGGEHITLIHVIYSVTDNLASTSIVACSKEQTTAPQPVLHHSELLANLQSITNGNTSYHTELPGSSRINNVFPQANIQTESYLYFGETHIRST